MNVTLDLKNEEQMLALGQRIALHSDALHIIYLQGVLGAGKTTFTRGFLQGLGYKGRVKSPTYTLVETYVFPGRTIHHFDLYRVHSIDELEEMGFRDYFTHDTLCLIEWPDKAQELITADFICSLKIIGDERQAVLSANTPAGWQVIQHMIG